MYGKNDRDNILAEMVEVYKHLLTDQQMQLIITQNQLLSTLLARIQKKLAYTHARVKGMRDYIDGQTSHIYSILGQSHTASPLSAELQQFLQQQNLVLDDFFAVIDDLHNLMSQLKPIMLQHQQDQYIAGLADAKLVIEQTEHAFKAEQEAHQVKRFGHKTELLPITRKLIEALNAYQNAITHFDKILSNLTRSESENAHLALQLHFKVKPKKVHDKVQKEQTKLRAKVTELSEIRLNFITRLKAENADLAGEKEAESAILVREKNEALSELSRREAVILNQICEVIQRHNDHIIERKDSCIAELQIKDQIIQTQLTVLRESGLKIPSVDRVRLVADLKQQVAKFKKKALRDTVCAAFNCIESAHAELSVLESNFVCFNRQIKAFASFNPKSCNLKMIDVYACQIRENNSGVNPKGYDEPHTELAQLYAKRIAIEASKASSPVGARFAEFQSCLQLLEPAKQKHDKPNDNNYRGFEHKQ